MSKNIKRFLIISIGLLLLSFGCATKPSKTVTPPKPAQAPVTPAPQAPQPTVPAPEKTEPAKEPAPAAPAPTPQVPAPRSTVPSPVQTEKQAPRATASLRLTEQARLLIESKKPDEAIGILEKAINIDTNNGRNYYYLAEAWIMKGNKAQAFEFNRLAGMYLNEDDSWKLRVQQQKERIGKMTGTH